MIPAKRGGAHSDATRVDSRREDVSRASATNSEDRVPLGESAKEEFKGADFVASALRGVEVVALDPQVVANCSERLDRGRQRAQRHARNFRERGEAFEEGEMAGLSRGLLQPFRLAE